MQYKVEFSESAKSDLFDIYYYVAMNDSFDKADKLMKKIKNKCETLSKMPDRGIRVKEIYEERPDLMQIFSSPYNIIYKTESNSVYVIAILDGRRNLQELLGDRILR
ncbi:MAG: type II toxin-antitoxin system RelE/ParE family toxin [Ignavibacteria bacterium]|nr:type II toxin-antitoxin system RelE/ParE family toxin [Ignavibacteria bacterium]MCC7159318.1 type II toxin-antitoxin system RelE/ParE family toxin [Ignavibacteria bacterium]